MASNLYKSAGLGPSQVSQKARNTPFGVVVDSGGIYNGRGQEVGYNPTVPGWGTTSGLGAGTPPRYDGPVLVSDGKGGRSAGGSAADSFQSAIDTLMGGVESARSAAAQSQARITNASRDLDAARLAAQGIGADADKLGGIGDQLSLMSDTLLSRANDVFGQGGALVNMDRSAGGLAGEFIRYWDSLSPDRRVSQAASDAQGAIQNQTEQAERDLSRRGVSASSGAFAALRRTAAIAASTAIARAKTIARQQGYDEQAAQLDKMLTAANTLYGMGSDVQKQSMEAKTSAGSAYSGAAGLRSTQAGVFGDIGGVEVSFGDLDLKNESLVQNAIQDVAAAQQAMAKFYEDTMPETVRESRNSSGTWSTTKKTFG